LKNSGDIIDEIFLVPIEMPVHLKAIALGALFVVVSFSYIDSMIFLLFFIKDYKFFGGSAKSKGGSSILGLCC
jgi:hypothetical protein